MLQLRSTSLTLLVCGSLVLFSAPLFACGGEDDGDESEDETSISLCGGEDDGDESEDETSISLCGGEDDGDESEDET